MSQPKGRQRLDQVIGNKYPEFSRSRIQAEIMAGRVKVDGITCDKPGAAVKESADIVITEPANPYVSRGGLKLAGALKDFSISVRDMVVLDVGASTGGFTDCLLKNGARLVYALDVGYGQLDWKLRQDPAVKVMERFNVRLLEGDNLPEKPDLAVVDVSFISLALVVPVLAALEIQELVLLVKPQFEVGREEADRAEGVIVNPELHRKVLGDMVKNMHQAGYCIKQVAFSCLAGPKGNLEFFLQGWLQDEGCTCQEGLQEAIDWTVEQAHRELGRSSR